VLCIHVHYLSCYCQVSTDYLNIALTSWNVWWSYPVYFNNYLIRLHSNMASIRKRNERSNFQDVCEESPPTCRYQGRSYGIFGRKSSLRQVPCTVCLSVPMLVSLQNHPMYIPLTHRVAIGPTDAMTTTHCSHKRGPWYRVPVRSINWCRWSDGQDLASNLIAKCSFYVFPSNSSYELILEMNQFKIQRNSPVV
jgi:hypothetical protein